LTSPAYRNRSAVLTSLSAEKVEILVVLRGLDDAAGDVDAHQFGERAAAPSGERRPPGDCRPSGR
jgi:hypothetical protein